MLVIWQATTIGATGAPEEDVLIEVRNESDGLLATIYSDKEGTTTKDNPFFSDSNGYAFFYTAGGLFKITATKGGYSATWRNVLVGAFASEDYVDTEIAGAKEYTDEEVYEVSGAIAGLEGEVELNKEIWKDQDGVEHRLWISDEDPDDEYDGENTDIWAVREV